MGWICEASGEGIIMNQLGSGEKEKAIAHKKPNLRESITLKVDANISDR